MCVLIGSCYNPILNKYLVRAPVLPFLNEYCVNDLCLVCICHRRRAIFSKKKSQDFSDIVGGYWLRRIRLSYDLLTNFQRTGRDKSYGGRAQIARTISRNLSTEIAPSPCGFRAEAVRICGQYFHRKSIVRYVYGLTIF